MSLLGRIRGETRSGSITAPPTWLIEALNPGGKLIGKPVTVDSALGLVPIYSAVSLISGAVATLPLVVYANDERVTDLRADLLHRQPNPEMAADELWEIVTSHLLLWGNAFLYKKQGPLGVSELWPISPRRVTVSRIDGVRTFFVEGRPFYEDDILHIRGLSEDGLLGYSPVQVNKQAIANALAQQGFVAEFLNDGGRPSVILRHPQHLSTEAARRLKASWDSVGSGGTAVLEEGIEVERWTMPLADAQFVEQQQFSDLRIAQMFNLPPSKLGAKSGDSLTYSTTEQQGQDFVTYCLARWLKRIEASLRRDPEILPPGYEPEFLVEGLLRADTKTRFEAYRVAIESGFMTIDEVRTRENLPTLDLPQIGENSNDPSA
jgi:HK97 family phage portal protein